ncbi:MAG: DUF411 domain-containing protein [Methylococcales bacterium]|nr:DUF411 domain-containing protein [Methylococcales bacterium]
MSKIRIKTSIVLSLLVLSFNSYAEEKAKDIEVYRSPTCGCCSQWISHLKKNNFNVKDHVIDDVQMIKDKYGISKEMSSCHTALVDGYLVEGHVPASDILTLLKDKPKIVGISVPGMPMGTPGMEMGSKKDAYKVVSFDQENKYKVFNSYKGN